MIRDLRNHPSIVVWVPGDETFQDIYQNKRLHYYQLAHDLVTGNDPSRLMMPAGDWADELAEIVEHYMKDGLELDDARNKALELLPIFVSPYVYWDVHKCLHLEPVYATMKKYHRILCGAGKPVTFDEFGQEGMPNWELSRGEWWYKRWTINPTVGFGKKYFEPTWFGRELTADDWPLSQAYQALVNWRVLSYIRESGAFAGFSNCFLRDFANNYMGIVDHRGREKLAFFIFRNILEPFFISAMHGNFSFKREDSLPITVINNGRELRDGKLTVKITDEKGRTVEEKAITGLTLPQGSTQVLSYAVRDFTAGLYACEYHLHDKKDNEVGRSLDIFFIE
jgi:hypothetical protein